MSATGREVDMLDVSMQFSQVEVLPMRTWPFACKDVGVCSQWLSIKLSREGEDGDGDRQVNEASHSQSRDEGRGLREVLVLRQGEEGFMEGTVGYEDGGI